MSTTTTTMKGIWLENKEISFRENLPMSFPEGEVVVKVCKSNFEEYCQLFIIQPGFFM